MTLEARPPGIKANEQKAKIEKRDDCHCRKPGRSYTLRHIAGVVAAITESDPGVASEKASDSTLG
jgi:hypothetical protein